MVRTSDRQEAQRYLAAGARLKRLAHDMAIELSTAAPNVAVDAPTGISVRRLRADVDALAQASASSTPEGHPDHGFWPNEQARLAYWRRLVAGEVSGPLLDASRELRTSDNEIAGALVITRMPPSSWWPGGPWISELFMVPPYQGRGMATMVLGSAIRRLRLDGEPRLGLTVTEGNPAERLYARLGFSRIRTVYLIEG